MILSLNPEILLIANTHTHRTLNHISINKGLSLPSLISIRDYKSDDSYYSNDAISNSDKKVLRTIEIGYNEVIVCANEKVAMDILIQIDAVLS